MLRLSLMCTDVNRKTGILIAKGLWPVFAEEKMKDFIDIIVAGFFGWLIEESCSWLYSRLRESNRPYDKVVSVILAVLCIFTVAVVFQIICASYRSLSG